MKKITHGHTHHHPLPPPPPPPPPPTYTLTVVLAGAGSGAVKGLGIDTDAGSFAQQVTSGTIVTLTETPAAGSTFNSWSGAGTGAGTTRTVTMTADKTVTATFALVPPPPPANTVPGTNTLVTQDLTQGSNPTTLWKQVSDAFYNGATWTSTDNEITRLADAVSAPGGPWRGGGIPNHGEDLDTLDYEWYYNWTKGSALTTSVPFVPMIFDAAAALGDLSSLNDPTGTKYLLGFNEPDNAGQANMSYTQALNLWPNLMATGRKLGSPAVTTGANTWRANFLKGCQDRGYRVDFICVHWYSEGGTAADLVNYLTTVHTNAASANQYGQSLPIWLTEWDAYNGSVTANTNLITAAGSLLAGLPWLHRVGWYANRSVGGPLGYNNVGLCDSAGAVTSVGAAYRAWPKNDPPDNHIAVGQTVVSPNYWRLGISETRINGAQTWPRATVAVNDTSDFPDPAALGYARSTASVAGVTSFTYTGKTGTTFTGCSHWTRSGATSGTLNDAQYIRPQSITDQGVVNSSTRTQFVSDSATNTFAAFGSGDEKIIYMSIRCQSSSPLPAYHTSGNGGDSQIWAIKPASNPNGLPPLLQMVEHSTGATLVRNYNGTATQIANFTFPKGQWTRFAIAVRYSNDPAVGYVQVWGDLDGSGTFTDLTGQVLCRTLYDGTLAGTTNTLAIGPSQNLTIRGVYRDYANIQVFTFTGTTPPPPPPPKLYPTSPFWTPVGSNPTLDPNSANVVANFNGQGPWANIGIGYELTNNDWGRPYYEAKSSDPTVVVHGGLGGSWPGSTGAEGNVIHVPPGARPAGGQYWEQLDGGIVIKQPNGMIYSAWRSRDPVDGYAYQWEKIDSNYSGVANDHGRGICQAGLGPRQGQITYEELVIAQNIPHALFCEVRNWHGRRYPGWYPDDGKTRGGQVTDPNAPPMSGHFFLNYTLAEVNALNVPSWKKVLLRAMVQYGLYTYDNGSAAHSLLGDSDIPQIVQGLTPRWYTWAKSNLPSFFDSGVGKTIYTMNINSGVDWTRLKLVPR